jgi:hypothetical protein
MPQYNEDIYEDNIPANVSSTQSNDICPTESFCTNCKTISEGVVSINPTKATGLGPNLSPRMPASGPASPGIAIVRNKQPDSRDFQ